MRSIWLKYKNRTSYTPEEVCEKGLTTPRGTFIFVADEQVYKPEAIQRCHEMGAILAPITEREDFDKLIEFGDKCKKYRMPKTYWLGYEAFSNDTRVFSNGDLWNWDKHTKIYSKMHDKGELCTLHILNFQQPSHVFVTGSYARLCYQSRRYSLCLKPTTPKCTENEAIMQNSEEYNEKLVSSMLANGTFFVVLCILVVMMFRNRK